MLKGWQELRLRRGPSSSNTTSNPRAESVAAVTAPPGPDPITTTCRFNRLSHWPVGVNVCMPGVQSQNNQAIVETDNVPACAYPRTLPYLYLQPSSGSRPFV